MIFGIIGIIALILGMLHVFFPKVVESIDKVGRKIVLTPERMVKHRAKFALFYIIGGIFLVYVGFFFLK